MHYKEFHDEGNTFSRMEAPFIEKDLYGDIHENTSILCHDVFIKCSHNGVEGYLLVKRLREPAKDIHWPIGGRALRGVSTEESLRRRALDECALTLTDITYIGVARTFFASDPFGHGKGTDTLNLVYVAKSKGELKLNNLHADPLIVNKENYELLKDKLHQYNTTYLETILRTDLR